MFTDQFTQPAFCLLPHENPFYSNLFLTGACLWAQQQNNGNKTTSSGKGFAQPQPPAEFSDRAALIWISTFTVPQCWSHAHGHPRAVLGKHLIRLNKHLRGQTINGGANLNGLLL